MIVDRKSNNPNCLKTCFADLGHYRGAGVTPLLPSSIFKWTEFILRPVTKLDLYKVLE